jgi:hypothetical protein
MPPRRLPREEEPELSEEEAQEAFTRLQDVTSRLLRVPKTELEARLAEKRIRSRRRISKVED